MAFWCQLRLSPRFFIVFKLYINHVTSETKYFFLFYFHYSSSFYTCRTSALEIFLNNYISQKVNFCFSVGFLSQVHISSAFFSPFLMFCLLIFFSLILASYFCYFSYFLFLHKLLSIFCASFLFNNKFFLLTIV